MLRNYLSNVRSVDRPFPNRVADVDTLPVRNRVYRIVFNAQVEWIRRVLRDNHISVQIKQFLVTDQESWPKNLCPVTDFIVRIVIVIYLGVVASPPVTCRDKTTSDTITYKLGIEPLFVFYVQGEKTIHFR